MSTSDEAHRAATPTTDEASVVVDEADAAKPTDAKPADAKAAADTATIIMTPRDDKATVVNPRPPDARLSEVETMVFVPSEASKARREFNRYGRIEFLREQVRRITHVPQSPKGAAAPPKSDRSMLLGFSVTLVLCLAGLAVWYFVHGRSL